MYADDILITRDNSAKIQQLIATLHKTFALKDLGTLNSFLGIEAHRITAGTLLLTQSKYIKDLLHKADMDSSKPMPTPMTSGLRLLAHGSTAFSDPSLYRSMVGAFQYATITRPDITSGVNKMCQFMHNPL